jgi:MFS family permease
MHDARIVREADEPGGGTPCKRVMQMALARGFNGVGLALVVPAIYSLVADYSDDATRGSAFGWMVMAQSMGHVTGNSLGVLLAATSFFGVPGWRLAFYALALVSASLASLTWLLGADPRPSRTKATAAATLSRLVREAKDVVRVPTFQIIVAQGVAGTVPWSALSFAAMWLELVGFTHWQTSAITTLNSLANALGALFAGFVGDPLARRFPNTGRIALAQVCTASTVPLAAVLLLALPDDPAAGAAYAAAFFVLGFAMPWCPVTTNYPIFAEIVPETARTTVYAIDRCLESVFASFAPPLVGILAERVFGYQPAASGTSVDVDRENAAALGKAVFAEVAVPIAVCCLTYSALYWTYPADRQRAQVAALQAAQEDKDWDCEASVVANATTADGLNQALLLHGSRVVNPAE